MDFTFEFSKICSQGVYFSNFTATSLDDFLEDSLIPVISNYHSIGCSPSLLPILAKMETLQIVQKYRQFFAKRNTIIDLLLPYYHPNHSKSYLGRFIIFRGQLLGIRLSTGKSPFFQSWPRSKAKTIHLKENEDQSNLLIGQFSLNLANLRIGLLFGNQVMSLANQYINCCFDMIVLMCQQAWYDEQVEAKIKQLCMRVQVVQIRNKEKFQYLRMEHLKDLSEGTIHLFEKRKIDLGYYSLNKIYSRKQWLQLNRTALPSLQINLQALEYLGSNQCQSNLYSHYNVQSQLQYSNILLKVHQLYLNRLLSLFCFNQGTKIVLLVQQSPMFLCFLFIIEKIFEQSSCKTTNLKNMFHCIGFSSTQFDFFLKKSGIIDPEDIQKIQEQKYSSQECYWLQKLSQIGNQTKKQWFSVLGKNLSIQRVVELLNKRTEIYQNRQKGRKFLQTYVIYEFFSFEELTYVYFSQEFKQFIGNDEYLHELWIRHPFKLQSEENWLIKQNINNFDSNNQSGNHNIEQLLRYNFLHYQFQKWVSRLDSFEQRERLFSHFLFRSIGVIKPTYTIKNREFSTNFAQQLLSISKTSIIQVISLFRQFFTNPVAHLQHKRLLQQQKQISFQNIMHLCHSCGVKLQRSQLFGCRFQNCTQYFCYKCLFLSFSYQPEYLINISKNVNDKKPYLRVCPACQGLCISFCFSCSKGIKISPKNKHSQEQEICHLCRNLFNHKTLKRCQNSKCQEAFCKICLLNCQLKEPINPNSKWQCSTCKNKCKCNTCENKIKTNLISRARYLQIHDKDEKQKHQDIQFYNKSPKVKINKYFSFKNKPSSCQTSGKANLSAEGGYTNDQNTQQAMESLGICKKQQETDQQTRLTSKKGKISTNYEPEKK